MNLATLQSRLYDRLNLPATPSSDVVSRLLGYLNLTNRSLMAKKQMSRFRRMPGLSFSAIANSPFATLPQACSRIFAIQDRTNQKNLDEMELSDLRNLDPGLNRSSSFPDAFVILNFAAAVARQPSVADNLFVLSTAAGDGATKTVYIEGLTAGGYYRTASVALNGVTAVNINAAITDWIEVQKFSLALTGGGSTTATGVITLLQTSGLGQELARIPIGRSYPRYTQIQLYPYPTTAVPYFADVELHVEDMAQAGDESFIPSDYHGLLIDGALALEYERREKTILYSQARARYREMLADLYQFTARQALMSPNTSYPYRWSQLGPYFPPGS